MQFRFTSMKAGREAAVASLAVLATLAAAASLPGVAVARRAKYHSAFYKVVYAGSGTYAKQTNDGIHSISVTESFNWTAKYDTDLSTRPKAKVLGPLISGTGGGTWNYKYTLSARGATLTCAGTGTLKPAIPWNIEPAGGMIKGKTEPGGSVDLLVPVVQSGGPFNAAGTQSGDGCQPNQAMDAAAAPWGEDVLGANVHLAKSSIGKRQIVDQVSSGRQNLRHPGTIPPGLLWSGTVTFKKG